MRVHEQPGLALYTGRPSSGSPGVHCWQVLGTRLQVLWCGGRGHGVPGGVRWHSPRPESFPA